MTDLIIKNAILTGHHNPVTISIKGNRIERIDVVKDNNKDSKSATKNVYDAKGNFVCSGFFESHIHLDKACILDRCTIEKGDLNEAVAETSKAKEGFTEQDVFDRASKVLEMAIKKGTVGLRTFVETDEKNGRQTFNNEAAEIYFE